MRESFAFSYGLLCVVMALEALVLHEALRRAARLSRVYSGYLHRPQAKETESLPWYFAPGTRAPEFSAQLLGTDRIVTRADLEGRETILLFVSPQDAGSLAYQQMGPAFGSMLETVEGEVYLVCTGDRETCQRFIGNSGVRAILDEDGKMARSFQVSKTPRAVQLDEETRVARYGEPDETRMVFDNGDNDEAIEDSAGSYVHDDPAGTHGTQNGVSHG